MVCKVTSALRTGALCLVAFALWAPVSEAQEAPHIGYLFPAGGRRGTRVEVTVGGQHLSGASGLHVSGEGITAVVVEHRDAPNRKEMRDLRAAFRELQKRVRDQKRARRAGPAGAPPDPPVSGVDSTDWVPSAELEIARMRRMYFDPKKQPNSQISETVALCVTIGEAAAPGWRELRLRTANGLSNPLRFDVGQLPEQIEPRPDATAGDSVGAADLPMVWNGQILPGEVDHFRFRARGGQQLVAVARARRLIPYLADAVPGWFQAAMAIHDADGDEVAYADDYRFHPDPVIACEIPADGEYILSIRDAIYRGREDFVYRVTVGELPFVTDIFPMGGQAGGVTTVSLAGWNLPSSSLEVDTRDRAPGVHPVCVLDGGDAPLSVPFAVGILTECQEAEVNDVRQQAQSVSLPVIVNGRIDRPGDWDVYRLEGVPGEVVVAEVHARRLGSPLDAYLRLTDASGAEVSANDDYEDPGAGLITHQADPRLTATVPVGEACFLHIGDTQQNGGRAYAYRLRISAPSPDFEIWSSPASINVRAGGAVPITVHVARRDGFTGEVEVEWLGSPTGFHLGGARIPPGVATLRLTLTAPPQPLTDPVPLSLRGRAVIDGRTVYRRAVPAEEMMQAFSYWHLVPADSQMVCVTGRRRAVGRARLLGRVPVRLGPGRASEIRFRMPGRLPLGQIRFALNDPPRGVSLGGVRTEKRRVTLVVAVDGTTAPAAQEGNLIIDAYLEKEQPPRNGKPRKRKRQVHLGVVPAVPFELGVR